jgi:adenylate cyclase
MLQVVDLKTGAKTQSVLCTPVFDRRGLVIGVLEVVNKKQGLRFSVDDERSLAAMAAHVAVVLEEALSEESREQEETSESRLLDQVCCVSRPCPRAA